MSPCANARASCRINWDMPNTNVRPGPLSERTHPGGYRALRWLAVIAVVLFFHLWLGVQFARHVRTQQAATPLPVQIALLRPRPIETQPPAPPHPAVKPAPRPPPHPRATETSSLQAALALPAKQASAAEPASAATANESSAAAASTASGTASSAAAASAPQAASAAAGPAQAGEKFSLPPSIDLLYDTFFNGAQNQAGTLHWSTDGSHYDLLVSMPLPFFGTFSYESNGHVDAYGLAPDRYTETRGRRTPSVTRFERDASPPRIAFSRTPNTTALPAGAQDRFSMVMQLASLVRGDPQRYQPGVTREFFVADDDSAETWPIQTIGVETVTTRGGYVSATHFMRLPRHDGDRRRIDVWLAPSLGWIPIRILQTEPNGTQFELVYQRGTKVPPQITEPAPQSGTAASSTSSASAAAPAQPAPTSTPASASETLPQPASVAPASATPEAAPASGAGL